MKFSTWLTVPSVCAALILTPASGVLAGTTSRHHKAKKPVATHKSTANGPVAASMTAVADTKKETKTAAKPDAKVAKTGSKKHVAPMSAATGARKTAPGTTKSVVKHKAARHGTKARKPAAPKAVDAPKSDDVKSADASMTMPAAK